MLALTRVRLATATIGGTTCRLDVYCCAPAAAGRTSSCWTEPVRLPMEANTEQTLPAYTDFRPPRRWIGWTAAALALVGWWLSCDLTMLSLGQSASNPWLQATCGSAAESGGTFDCQSVLASKWSRVPHEPAEGTLAIPIAAFGMAYFAFVGVWYVFVGSPTRSRWARHLLISAIVFLGLAESVHMVYVMASVLHKWCAACLATHAINALLGLLTIVAFPWFRDRENLAPHPRGRLALATLAACTFVFLLHPALLRVVQIAGAAKRLQGEYTKIANDPEFARWQYERGPLREIPSDDARVVAGEPDAPNKVVVFIDAQCSACLKAYDLIEDFRQKHPGVLCVDCRHFPLDRSCNDAYPHAGEPASCAAARAAEAARDVGGTEGFRKMRRLLFQRRHDLHAAPYAAWAGELGLDQAAFEAAFESAEVRQRVQADDELARELGVESAPTLFLNGRRLRYWSKLETWEALLGVADPSHSNVSTTP